MMTNTNNTSPSTGVKKKSVISLYVLGFHKVPDLISVAKMYNKGFLSKLLIFTIRFP